MLTCELDLSTLSQSIWGLGGESEGEREGDIWRSHPVEGDAEKLEHRQCPTKFVCSLLACAIIDFLRIYSSY